MNTTFITESEVMNALPPEKAVDALRQALKDGYDPTFDFQRQSEELSRGEMLIMPSSTGELAGIKILTVAPDDPSRQQPRIQGVYVLFDGSTLAPTTVLEGSALTSLRTPAVSLAGIRDLIVAESTPLKTVVFGSGPQALAHAETLSAVLRDVRDVELAFIGRTRKPVPGKWLASGSAEAEAAVRSAELILCCTTASNTLIDREHVRADAIVVAMGSHSPNAREVGEDLMDSAQVVVEEVATALRECGDVIQAIEAGRLDAGELFTMREVVRGEVVLDRTAPVVFKTSGMPWEDLVVASAVAKAVRPKTIDNLDTVD